MKKKLIALAAAAFMMVSAVASMTIGVSAAEDETLVNVARGQTIEATSNYVGVPFFGIDQAVDGEWEIYNGANITTIGWSTSPYDGLAVDTPVDVTIILDKVYELHEIILYPQRYWQGTSFPREYELQVSLDGEEWTTVASDMNDPYQAATDQDIAPFHYPLDTPVNAEYFRIHITLHSGDTDPGTGSYMSGLGEIQLMGHEYTEPVETEPVETEPVETEPAETEPVETEPAETEPVETEPAETEPVETEPVETKPVETEPVETAPVATETQSETDAPAEEKGCASALGLSSALTLFASCAAALTFGRGKKHSI